METSGKVCMKRKELLQFKKKRKKGYITFLRLYQQVVHLHDPTLYLQEFVSAVKPIVKLLV